MTETSLDSAPTTPTPETSELEERAIVMWQRRILDDKAKWENDFKRMRENMDFVAGLQHEGQNEMRDPQDRYIINITLREVMNKVAQLYARNPKAEFKPRKGMDFEIWDETIEELMEAFQARMMTLQAAQAGQMLPPNMEAEAIWQDFKTGRKMQEIVQRICQTLEYLYQYQVDVHKPDFKEQMKQLVVRVITCGVGYCMPKFVREEQAEPSNVEVDNTAGYRSRLAMLITEKLESGDLSDADPEIETLKSLMLSLGHSTSVEDEYVLPERLEFDFPPATSIIPDSRCRSLREFVGARYITQEWCLPIEDINAFFGLSGEQMVKPGTKYVEKANNVELRQLTEDKSDTAKRPEGTLWRVIDAVTKTHFFIVEGHKSYIVQPEPLEPCVAGFWPLFTLTFNNIEIESECKATIYPPSDVEIIRSAQMEWNRTRDALRAQRNANAPTYITREGTLTPEDKRKIANREPNEVIGLQGVPADKEPAQVIQTLQVAAIDKNVYDTAPLEQDLMLGGGMQQANIGPAQPDVTATVGTIAEQSRLQVSSSNVDDLDCFLTHVAQAGGEMLLRGMSEPIVKQIVRVGALWPSYEIRKNFLNQIEMKVQAASSGRPNQALRVNTRMQIMPILLQAGANPMAVIEDLVKTMDDTIDVQKFFPLPGQALGGGVVPGAAAQPGPQAPSPGPSEIGQPKRGLNPPTPEGENTIPMPMAAA